MNKTSIKHTLAAVIGAIAVVGPQLLNLLGDLHSPRAALAASVVGYVVAMCLNGKAVALLNLFLPDGASNVTPEKTASDIVNSAKVLVLFAGLATLSIGACKTAPNRPDSFFQAVVTCAENNPENPQAEAAVVQCLTAAVGGDYAACLQGLVAAGHWTVDEIACIVRGYAICAATRINAGTAAGNEEAALANANAWLRSEQIRYR